MHAKIASSASNSLALCWQQATEIFAMNIFINKFSANIEEY